MTILTAHGRSDIGLSRKVNEDSFVIADLTTGKVLDEDTTVRLEVGERGVLLALSDGMGGASAGEIASAMVIESLQRSMTLQGEGCDPIIERAAEKANVEVWDASHQSGRHGMGATLTALHICGPAVHIAEVGDSRAYLLRAGNLLQMTRDQSYVQALIDSGEISAEQAENVPFKNVILQAMGQKADVSVALSRLELRERDCFLLCSDGLSNSVSAEEMRQTILSAQRLDAACAALIALANQRGGKDNITVLIGGVTGDLPPPAAGKNIADALQVLHEGPSLGP